MNKQYLKSIWRDQLSDLLAEKDQLILRGISLAVGLKKREITILTGVRRSGKSSLLKELVRKLPRSRDVLYLSFEDPRLAEFKAEDFELLYELWIEELENFNTKQNDSQLIAIFDEIQNVEKWEKWINFFSEQKKVKVFVTGSNSKLLSSELATHLTGRHHDLELFPLSFLEIAKHSLPEICKEVEESNALSKVSFAKLQKLFQEYFNIGGFPRAWIDHSPSILGEYYNDILHRDIVRRHNLRRPALIEGFGRAVMSDIGRRLNKTRLATDTGIAEANTVNNYFKYFEECYLGREVRKFDTSIRRQMRSQVKFYAIDPVLAKRVGIADESKDGFYLENLVFVELLRRGATVYYFQEADSAEVDFVIEERGGKRGLIQVCRSLESSKTVQRELKGFEEFQRRFPKIKIFQRLIITIDNPVKVNLPKEVEAKSFSIWAIEQAAS